MTSTLADYRADWPFAGRAQLTISPALSSIRAFVESHGFRASVRDGAVVFRVPFITLAGEAGSDEVTVRTMREALAALGY